MARHTEIYKSPEWEKVRQFVIIRANGLCERCQEKGRIKPGKEVHHIEELSDLNKHNWSISYDPDNLQFLCSDCHNEKHDRSIGLQKFLTPPG